MSLLGGYNFNNAAHEQLDPTQMDESNGSTSTSMENDKDERDGIQQLARQLSHQSAHDRVLERQRTDASTYTEYTNPFEYEKDSVLDPNSPNFKARAWVQAVTRSSATEADKNPSRHAGVAYKNLTVVGDAVDSDYQKSVGNIFSTVLDGITGLLKLRKVPKFQILRDFEGVVQAGELLVVLGPPGSGCSTFLKTIAGETHGFQVADNAELNYQGISSEEMQTRYRGEAIYTAEVDVHFPNLTVGETLYFAARARMSKNVPQGLDKRVYARIIRDITMATFGITHTINTKVGNDFVRGVSGGERKRVTIAEVSSGGAAVQCWDNSTRGLDSANAIEFCKTLRLGADYFRTTPLVAIYQAPQAAYDLFDKALVIYEGRQIYFGSTTSARAYFEDLGFHCPNRQTTADFLTSMTSPAERICKEGFEGRAPRTPDEFAAAWKASRQRQLLMQEIDLFNQQNPIGGEARNAFEASRVAQKAKKQSAKSPFTLSYGQQVQLCLWRGYRRLISDPTITLTQLFGNTAMGLIVASVFYNLAQDTSSFFNSASLLFFAVLLNAFGSALEILTLYAQRPIVEKQARYAYYHPSAEAFASIIMDLPYKIVNNIVFNTTLYFMTNLRREPGPFFFFLLISFFLTMAMSMIFRTIGSSSRSFTQAMTPAAIFILFIVMFTGFAIPTRYMPGWCRWLNYLDPVAYGFESLMVNQFHNRDFPCASLVPSYGSLAQGTQICSTVGSVAGQSFVNGDVYLAEAYEYYNSHRWRNFGFIIVFMLAFFLFHLLTTEYIGAKKSKGELLLFRKGHAPAILQKKHKGDLEDGSDARAAGLEKSSGSTDSHNVEAVIEKQTAIFHWSDVCYDIKIKGEGRRILDHVDGWVQPGTLTALMGVSGAGKTTLLDTLATRVTTGVVTGEMLVDGRECDQSFQRRTGYVQQQDLHLQTSTVREALNFSAILRQPAHVPRHEKLEYVDEVIKLLDMEEYADAVVGVPGEGLNVEQRKRLTIAVEMAAKPDLLLFLDEPTSGLDSQTSWAICDLMEKLTKAGQAILCTVHQPSAMLFQRFDRLLFLAKGGRTIYFGDIGENSKVLTSYFERNGSHTCPIEANPAEWMLEVIGAAPGSHSDIDWHETWKGSPEFRSVKDQLVKFKDERPRVTKASNSEASPQQFAATFKVQCFEVTKRVFEQYWRTPSYIFAKFALCALSAIFIGCVFINSANSIQGLQNQLLAIFMLFTIFGQIAQQIMPHFVVQRALYEARERPSKTYSWIAFMLSNIVVELPWNTLMGVFIFFCLYYPIGLQRNAVPDDQVTERGGLFFLYVLQFMLFTSTFTDMIIAGAPDAETGGNIANLLFSLCLIFCGVLASPTTLPGFWIFMYRVSPFTYLVDGMLSVGIANTEVVCDPNEYLQFNPQSGQTCLQFMQPWINDVGGYLLDDNAMSNCSFCPVRDTNVFLAQVSSSYSHRWRNFGILWGFIIFNFFAAFGFYWLARVPKKAKKQDIPAPAPEKIKTEREAPQI